MTTPDLSYLAPLDRLRSLAIELGGIRSLDGVLGREGLRALSLRQIRDFRAGASIGQLPGLRQLFLQSLPHVHALPDLRGARQLRRVTLVNLKGLTDLTALELAPALEDVALLEADRQHPEDLLPVLRNPRVRRVTAGFGSQKKMDAFAELRVAHGKAELPPGEVLFPD